ncbi:MAG: alpha-galactosidase [Armatimonadetes bacterium]|nr:alpha-galactosidase [Armatimonadota bacterium]
MGDDISASAAHRATGFAQEIPGGFVFEIGNEWITRRVHSTSGRLATTSLVNNSHGEEYLDETESEFEIELTGNGKKVVLESKDFKTTDYQTHTWDDSCRTIEAKLETNLNRVPLKVSVFYEAKAGADFISKWVTVHPCEIEGWVIRSITIENMKLREMVEGVVPRTRYPRQYDNFEDRVHSEPEKCDTSEPNKRFEYGDLARSVVSFWGYGEGLYFFMQSLLGRETYHRPNGLLMRQREFVQLADGVTTGRAIIGAYVGPPEIGFKRYNEFLMRNWCVVSEKSLPVSWSTWLVTLEGNKPLLANYDRNFLLEYIEYIRDAGFYDILHLDLGWEADYPLRVDPTKFPNGIREITERAKSAGLDMTFWVNPFSASYWKSNLETEHPEWLVPDKVSGRSGATALCVMTDYYNYVKERFVALATEMNARVIYWDGNDWAIPDCRATNHDHRDQEELEVKAWKRLAELCDAAHEARPDLIFVCFSLPLDNHRLHWLDQEQISDTYKFPTVQSELIQRQQLYQMTFEHPYKAIWGSWYGLNWHDAGDSDLRKRPLEELIHAEMSMIGNGIAQAGGGFDFKQAPQELMDFLKKLFAFRKRFEKYFDVYQHVLGFPDGKQVDGEGHIIDESGFIVLVNPTQEPQSVKVPLDEPELELDPNKKHVLTDWSNLERGVPIGSFATDSGPEIQFAPLEVKYIGVNLD